MCFQKFQYEFIMNFSNIKNPNIQKFNNVQKFSMYPNFQNLENYLEFPSLVEFLLKTVRTSAQNLSS